MSKCWPYVVCLLISGGSLLEEVTPRYGESPTAIASPAASARPSNPPNPPFEVRGPAFHHERRFNSTGYCQVSSQAVPRHSKTQHGAFLCVHRFPCRHRIAVQYRFQVCSHNRYRCAFHKSDSRPDCRDLESGQVVPVPDQDIGYPQRNAVQRPAHGNSVSLVAGTSQVLHRRQQARRDYLHDWFRHQIFRVTTE